MIPMTHNEDMLEAAQAAGQAALDMFRSRAIRRIEQIERALRGTKQDAEADGVRLAIAELEGLES